MSKQTGVANSARRQKRASLNRMANIGMHDSARVAGQTLKSVFQYLCAKAVGARRQVTSMVRVEIMRKHIRIIFAASLTVLVVAIICVTQLISDPSNRRSRNPRAERRISGIIDHYSEGRQGVLNAPKSVKAGEEFRLVINTFGSNCEERGAEDVTISPAGTTIEVFDYKARPDVTCNGVLKRLPHTVTLQIMKPGERLIRVLGERLGPDSSREPSVIEHRVVVGP